MSNYDSYLLRKQLPDNGTYRTLHNIVTSCTVLTFTFNYLIFYLSPPSKESFYYKVLTHVQGFVLFGFSIMWSLVLKFMFHFNYGFFYCEGYFYLLGLTSVSGYTLLTFFFGNYGASLVCSYLFRLYLLVDHNHFLRIPYVFPTIFVILEFLCSFVAPLTFYVGHSQFDPKRIPFNLTDEQLGFLVSRSVIAYYLDGFRNVFYPVYFLFLLTGASTICAISVYATIHQVKRKQSLMSARTTNYHLKALRVLVIQISVNVSISVCAPAVILASLFLEMNSYILYISMLMLGSNSLCLSILTLYLNPVYGNTIWNLLKLQVVPIKTTSQTTLRNHS